MEKDSFKISAELLQKNAAKASIRDLNAEFQRMGGQVIYKTSKKGDTYLLSHPNEKYLEEFRVRLFKELGILEEDKKGKEKQAAPKEEVPVPAVQQPPAPPPQKAPPPRYGEKYSLRRGWNVRSPAEFAQGRYNKSDMMPPEMPLTTKPSAPKRSSNEWRPEPKEEEDGFEDEEEDEEQKSFDERWGDVTDYLKLVEEALNAGAVDDGEIIKYAYGKKMPEPNIKKLKKLLWDNRCKGQRTGCPHAKKKFRFEELMKVCSGEVDGWEKIDSPFIRFLDIWEKNVERMYGPFKDKEVIVEGKISSYKPVYRKGHDHLKLLVYDTLVTEVEKGAKPVETRKFWVKVSISDFNKLTRGKKVHIDDRVKFRGKCVFDTYFKDYWIVDLTHLEVVKEGDGEVISAPQA